MARDTHKRGRKRTPKRGGQTQPVMDYPAIIKAHELKMVINNPASKFVVVTYWWGRGNLNKNYLRFGDARLDKAIANGTMDGIKTASYCDDIDTIVMLLS